ncbi:MAG: diheme cytochrome c-553 [Saprospiraceae bacterium]|nr:diheme cytochrome c-553 [Saprospiraceae bacterium]
MKNRMLTLAVIASLIGFVLACNQPSKEDATATKPTQEELVKRGEYLVTIMGCNDCHTPKVMGPNGPELDPTRMLSGHPADMPLAKIDTALLKDWVLFTPILTAGIGPWGVSYAANLTPDETGLGNWTEAQFKKALKEGKSKGMDGTRPLLPPMPWQNFVNISDEDVSAMFAYLQSIKPIANIVPNPQPLSAVSQ